MKGFCAAVTLLLLGACTPPPTPTIWSKPGASDDDVAQDSARCRLVARGFVPESPAPYPGAIGPSAFAGEGVNLRRERFFGECMLQKGYSPQTATEPKVNPEAEPGPAGETKEPAP